MAAGLSGVLYLISHVCDLDEVPPDLSSHSSP